MSAEILSATGNNASLQGTSVGGSKPLYRFIRTQPKIIGIIVLVLGSSFLIVSIGVMSSTVEHIWTTIPPGMMLGALFIICGILYILTAHNPTKKTVTISLALSIVTILGAFWTVLHILPDLIHSHYYYSHHAEDTDEVWLAYHENMAVTLEAIILFYSFVGALIFIVMSALAGSALHSTKSQAIVVMTTTPTEAPAE